MKKRKKISKILPLEYWIKFKKNGNKKKILKSKQKNK